MYSRHRCCFIGFSGHSTLLSKRLNAESLAFTHNRSYIFTYSVKFSFHFFTDFLS